MNLFKKYWGVIALAVVVLLLLDKCSNNPIKTIISKPEVIYRDSIREVYTHTTDTIDRWRERVVSNTEYVFIDSPQDSSIANHYLYKYNDSILDAKINVYADERPDSVIIDCSSLERFIKDSVYVRDKITEKVRVNQVYFGGNATLYPGFNSLSMGLDFISKKGWQAEIGMGYDLSNNNPMMSVGYKKLISFRRKQKARN
jgi:hypothetical protein